MSVIIIIYWVITTFGLFAYSLPIGVAALILGPIIILLFVAFIRLSLEMYFNIADMREMMKKQMEK